MWPFFLFTLSLSKGLHKGLTAYLIKFIIIKPMKNQTAKSNKTVFKVEKVLNNHTLELIEIHEKLNDITDDLKGLKEFRNETNNNFDKMLVILNRLDQERVFTNHRFNRIEKTIGLVEL